MTKAEMAVLDRIMDADVQGALNRMPRLWTPPNMHTKTIDRLIDKGWIEEASAILPGRFPVHLKGYIFTIKGHMNYCMNCKGD